MLCEQFGASNLFLALLIAECIVEGEKWVLESSRALRRL